MAFENFALGFSQAEVCSFSVGFALCLEEENKKGSPSEQPLGDF